MAVFLIFAICLLSAKPVCTFAASDAPGRVKLQKVTTPAYGQVKITWKKATNATAYYIYYKEATAGKWKKLASVKSDKTGYKVNKDISVKIAERLLLILQTLQHIEVRNH